MRCGARTLSQPDAGSMLCSWEASIRFFGLSYRYRFIVFCLGIASGLSLIGDAQGQEIGRNVVVREAADGDIYAAGSEVIVQANVQGDLVAAGGSVAVTGSVSEDLVAAGGSVSISGPVGDDVRVAGGSVSLDAPVSGHAAIAGGEVRIEAGGRIAEWAWLSGGEVTMAGQVGGDLKVAAGSVQLNGTVDGDAELASGEIRIGKDAVIGGDLIWRSREEPRIADGASIAGEIRRGEPLPDFEQDSGFWDGLLGLLGIVVAAGLLYTLLRPAMDAVFTSMHLQPGLSLLLGLAVFAITPVVTVLLFVTGVGWLLGLLVIVVYVLSLALGGLVGIVLVARWLLLRFRDETAPGLTRVWLAIALVVLVINLLYVLPPVGMLVGTAILFLGLGSMAHETYRRLRGY
jgi:hypothetical protein